MHLRDTCEERRAVDWIVTPLATVIVANGAADPDHNFCAAQSVAEHLFIVRTLPT
jgi:hypothetical protein